MNNGTEEMKNVRGLNKTLSDVGNSLKLEGSSNDGENIHQEDRSNVQGQRIKCDLIDQTGDNDSS